MKNWWTIIFKRLWYLETNVCNYDQLKYAFKFWSRKLKEENRLEKKGLKSLINTEQKINLSTTVPGFKNLEVRKISL